VIPILCHALSSLSVAPSFRAIARVDESDLQAFKQTHTTHSRKPDNTSNSRGLLANDIDMIAQHYTRRIRQDYPQTPR